MIKHVEQKGVCPHGTCDVNVEKDSPNIKYFQAILDRMFVDYNKVVKLLVKNKTEGIRNLKIKELKPRQIELVHLISNFVYLFL